MELLWQALRQVVFILDQVTYGLIPSAYELIFYLANVNLFNNDILTGVINRIYLLLGIFMLFKVAFSLVQYMIDPNTFSDKSKGFGKLITNTLVALVLLVMTPFIFQKAYEFQGDILLSNVIPRLVLGDTSYVDFTKDSSKKSEKIKAQQDEVHSMGVDVQFTLFSAFYHLNTSDDENGFENCRPTAEHPLANVLGSSDMINGKPNCWKDVQTPLTEELHKQGGTLRGLFKYSDTKKSDGTKCPNKVCDERDFSNFGKLLWWIKAGGNSPFTIEYQPIISALAGGYLLLLLITFAIDIAIRVFKLLFLQTVAPIAIVSYMDPKESVSSGKFHNWLVECGKTYGSLFLRLAVIYFAILLVKIITSQVFASTGNIYYSGVRPTDTMNIFVYVFLVLGIFTFAKKVPQMIESIFGIKMSGELNLNPFKAIGDNQGVKLGLGAAGIAASGAVGGLGTAVAATYKSAHDLDNKPGRAALSGAGGLIAGTFRGLKGGIQSKGKYSRDVVQASMGKTMRSMDVRSKTGGFMGAPARMADRARYAIGASSKYEYIENKAKMYDDTSAKLKTVQDRVESKVSSSKAGKYLAEYRKRADQIASEGRLADATEMRKQADAAEKALREAYISNNGRQFEADAIMNGTYNIDGTFTLNGTYEDKKDDELLIAKQAAEISAKESGIEIVDINDYGKIKDAKTASTQRAAEIRSTKEYDDAKDIHENIQAQAKQGHIKR